jgi:hypothetical protein
MSRGEGNLEQGFGWVTMKQSGLNRIFPVPSVWERMVSLPKLNEMIRTRFFVKD